MIKNNTNNNFYLIPGLIIFSFLLRFTFVYFVRDIQFEHEWGILLSNLIKYKSYSLYTFDDQLIPSVFMPPLYLFVIYFLKVITFLEESNLLNLIILVQIILSTYSVYLFYQINQNFFQKELSFFNSIIFSIIPLNIYACGQISSINLQIFLSLVFLKFLLLIIKSKNYKYIYFFALSSGLLMLTRGEFVLIFGLILFFVYFDKKINFINLIKIIVIVTLITSPYLIRNYVHFNQIVIVKSLGWNLWKGNNELSSIEGYENFEKFEFKNLKLKLDNLKKDKQYEINRDKTFLKEAISNLNENPPRYLGLFFKKIFSYYFVDLNSKYPNYYNFFHIFPIVLISVLSFPGMFIFFKTNKFKQKYLGIYFFLNLIIFSIFFIVPRYKLIILPIQIILAAYFIQYVFNKLNINIINEKNFKWMNL